MNKLIYAAACILVIATGCHQKKEIASTAGATSAAIKEVRVDEAVDVNDIGAAYNIDSISINGDILSVFVNYSGGCKMHSFDLISNGMYAKSLPPQLTLCLKHTNNEDHCRKLVSEEQKFNISKVQYPGTRKLIIKLGDKQATYMYQSK